MAQLTAYPVSSGSTYDVSPPAATTEATASGVALANKTFGAFTGADAGSIDGYTARTVNAAGATSWSGSGLGAYTPSGGADADAGVLALDATIGGVVVATALHDYSRAAASAGGLAELEEIDLTDVETTVITTTGTHTVRNNADTLDAFTVYVLDASSPSGWTLTFDGAADPPILLEGVQGTNSTGRAVWCCIVPSAWAAAPDWDEDRWFAQVLFTGITCQGVVSGARLEIFAGGIQPAAAAAAAGAGGRTVSPWADGIDADWYDERWTSSTARTQQALTTTALPSSSMAILFDKLRDRLAVEDGASALSTDLTTAHGWTEDRVQSAADIAETDAAGVWTSGFGMFLYVYNRATAESSAAGIKQCKVYGVTL